MRLSQDQMQAALVKVNRKLLSRAFMCLRENGVWARMYPAMMSDPKDWLKKKLRENSGNGGVYIGACYLFGYDPNGIKRKNDIAIGYFGFRQRPKKVRGIVIDTLRSFGLSANFEGDGRKILVDLTAPVWDAGFCKKNKEPDGSREMLSVCLDALERAGYVK